MRKGPLSLLVRSTESVWPCIAAHSFCNLYGLVLPGQLVRELPSRKHGAYWCQEREIKLTDSRHMVHLLIGHGKLWLCTWSVDRSEHGHGTSTVRILDNANGTLSIIHDLSLKDCYSTTYSYSLRTTPQTKLPLFHALALTPISTAADPQSSPWL